MQQIFPLQNRLYSSEINMGYMKIIVHIYALLAQECVK
jgi:hypothetical protein